MSLETSVSEIKVAKYAAETESLKPHYEIVKNDKCGHRICRRRVFLCFLIFTVFLIAAIFAIKCFSKSTTKFCLSDECLRSAAALKQTMNFRVDPCEDFYEYVCGNWAEERPESDTATSWMKERQVRIYRNIRFQLEREVRRYDPKPVAQAKMLYRSCLNAGQRTLEAAQEIVRNLQEFGLPKIPSLLNENEAQDFDWVATLAKVQRKIGLNIFIEFYVDTDLKDSNRSRLWLSYRSPSKNKDTDEAIIKEKLTDHLDAIDEHFYPSEHENTLTTLAEKYFNFLNDIPKKEIDEDEDPFDVSYYNLQELQSITDSYFASNETISIWKHYFHELFAPFPGAEPDPEEKLVIHRTDLQCLNMLIKVMFQQDPQVIQLYIWEQVVSYFMYHEFEEKKSKDICAKNAHDYMELAVSYLISSEDFLANTKPRVQEMLEDIRGQFNQMVHKTDWMDSRTRNATLEKSLAMRSFIGFPEWIVDIEQLEAYYDGLQITKNLYIRNVVNSKEFSRKIMLRTWRTTHGNRISQELIEVNASNNLRRNAIYIPVAFIQYPFYYLGLESLNYGAIGSVLGHELTHSYDDEGRFFDKFGIKKSWWSTKTHEGFEDRAQCMVKQYSNYSLPEGHINGTLTLAENIADNGGLRQAFRAYRAYIKRHGPEPNLPGFESISHEQLFFIAFGNLWCSSLSPEIVKFLLKNDPHSPGKFRVIGTVSNMNEFSEAFQCPSGSAMNPAKKCQVW